MNVCVKCGCQQTIGDQSHCAYCLLKLGLDFSDSDSDAWALDEGDAVGEFSNSSDSKHPTSLGNYKIISEIARGGMGIVYLAQQKGLQRVVALKLILAGQMASVESIERFRLEATTAANLHHPCIVPIYEIGQVDSQHFYSMEFVDGKSLADERDKFGLNIGDPANVVREKQKQIATCMAQVADAIEYAHQRGGLHRDIKPSNILIDGVNNRPRITDFGLAKLINDVGAGLTLSSTMLGSPSYLSPEQANGDFEEITIATDVYGIGATLYELLVGHPPFVGKNAVDVLRKAMQGNPRNVREINPSINADLATICMHCLEKNPADRYSSASALAEDLQRFALGQPILARQAGSVEQVIRWARNHPRQVATLLFIMFTIFVGSSTAFWQWYRAETANAELSEKLIHLEWSTIDTLINEDQTSLALSRIASLLRKDPSNRQAAMFSLSVLEHNRFPVPSMAPLRHPLGSELTVAHLSPDGMHVVSASLDKTVRIWNRSEQAEAGLVLKHPDSVLWMDLSADGRWIASGCADGSLHLWDYQGQEKEIQHKFNRAVQKVLFHPDSSSLLAYCDKAWVIVDLQTGAVSDSREYSSGKLMRLKFISDGTELFIAHRDGPKSTCSIWNSSEQQFRSQVKTGDFEDADAAMIANRFVTILSNNASIWSFATGERERGFSSVDSQFSRVSVNPSGSRVAVAGLNLWTRAWDLATGNPLTPELSHDYLVTDIAFVDDERFLSWSDDSSVKLWSSSTGRAVVEPCRHSNRVVHAELVKVDGVDHILSTVSHNNRRTKESGFDTGAVHLWKLLSSNPCEKCGPTDIVGYDGGAMSPDGRLVAVGKTDQTISVLDSQSREVLMGPIKLKGGAWGIVFTPDNSLMIVTTSAGQILVWSCERNEPLFPPKQLATTIQPMGLSSDGSFFITGSTDGKVRAWETKTGELLWEQTHGGEINSLAISRDGERVATAGENRIINVWNGKTGQLSATLVGHKNEVMRVQFSPDAKFLASASQDFTARVWDLNTGETKWSFGHQGEVIDVDISADGKLVATASRDHTVGIWDLEKGTRFARPLVHPQAVRNVQFLPNRSLLTIDFSGIRIWDPTNGLPETVRMKQARIGGTGFQACQTISYCSEKQRLLSVYDAQDPIICHVATPTDADVPEWWPDFLESIAGQQANEDYTALRPSPRVDYLQLHKKVASLGNQGFYAQWFQHWSQGLIFAPADR